MSRRAQAQAQAQIHSCDEPCIQVTMRLAHSQNKAQDLSSPEASFPTVLLKLIFHQLTNSTLCWNLLLGLVTLLNHGPSQPEKSSQLSGRNILCKLENSDSDSHNSCCLSRELPHHLLVSILNQNILVLVSRSHHISGHRHSKGHLHIHSNVVHHSE